MVGIDHTTLHNWKREDKLKDRALPGLESKPGRGDALCPAWMVAAGSSTGGSFDLRGCPHSLRSNAQHSDVGGYTT